MDKFSMGYRPHRTSHGWGHRFNPCRAHQLSMSWRRARAIRGTGRGSPPSHCEVASWGFRCLSSTASDQELSAQSAAALSPINQPRFAAATEIGALGAGRACRMSVGADDVVPLRR